MASERHSRRKPSVALGVPEFLPLRRAIGIQLRRWRERSGVTLSALEVKSGVSDSEISRVEEGDQSCRLESFIRICAALGLPAAYVLDDAVAFNSAVFETAIRGHQLVRKISNKDKAVERVVVKGLAGFAAFASHLLLCSRALARATAFRYPHQEIESRFFYFADWLEGVQAPEKRLELLLSLRERTVDTLQKCGLIPEAVMRRLVEPLFTNKRADPTFSKRKLEIVPIGLQTPFKIEVEPAGISRFGGKIKPKKHLTEAASFGMSVAVKQQMPALLTRLRRATAKTGKKSELAKSLGVPLASVSRWLSGKREPGGEITLLLQQWVNQEEARQK